MATRKIVSKNIKHAATTYVGVDGEIWVDTATNLLKVSDGTTPGGAVITTDGTVTTWANIADINNSSGPNKIAIGEDAGSTSQGIGAIAIGDGAAEDSQGIKSVAIGSDAGQTAQGTKSIAIGDSAGYLNQAANSIVVNATGQILNNTTADTFVVKPVRDVSGSLPSGFKQLAHNATTGEIISYG